jgi:hypothetical protein
MAVAYKVLGQSIPAATTNTTLYTVPAATSAVCSTLSICNQGTVTTNVRVAIRPAGATLATNQYIIFDNQVNLNDTLFFTIGLSLATTDVVTVYAGTANVSFNLFGSEIT